MGTRSLLISFVCLVTALAFFVAAGAQLGYINNARKDMDLVINEPLENAPPSLAFATVAMGAFRGLVVNILWVRADRLKQEGQFFDAKQLAEWITVMQPRFASVWEFQAWNMAYNISVAVPASQPEQRWHWVRNGYELLRDRGIPMNPNSLVLYRELSRIFQHKMGGVTDDVHKYYKLQLALAMQPLLGPADNDYFKTLAQAPRTLEQAMEQIDGAREFVAALAQANESFAVREKFIESYISFRQNPGRFNQELFELIERYQDTQLLHDFDAFARAYTLRNEWKLEPEFMIELNEKYGPTDWEDPDNVLPLEWRHPATHAIYWAVKGLRQAGDTGQFSVDEANIDRMVAHSLQLLFRDGRIYISRGRAGTEDEPMVAQAIYLRPDLRMFDAYHDSQLDIIEKYSQMEGSENYNPGTHESMEVGHRNFLINAVESFYQSGRRGHATRIYNKLRELYPRQDVEIGLTQFVRGRMREHLRDLTISNANEMIHAMLMESYFRFAMGEDDEAAARERLAADVYEFYNSTYGDEERIALAPMELLRYLALQDFLNDGQYPYEVRFGLLARIQRERPDIYEMLLEQEQVYMQFQQELERQQN